MFCTSPGTNRDDSAHFKHALEPLCLKIGFCGHLVQIVADSARKLFEMGGEAPNAAILSKVASKIGSEAVSMLPGCCHAMPSEFKLEAVGMLGQSYQCPEKVGSCLNLGMLG